MKHRLRKGPLVLASKLDHMLFSKHFHRGLAR